MDLHSVLFGWACGAAVTLVLVAIYFRQPPEDADD